MDHANNQPAPASYTDAPLHRYPRWAMRFWHGMDFGTWMSLLARNRFRFAPIRTSMVTTVTIASWMTSLAGVFESLLLGHAIGRSELKDPPLFVLGHWRSG